MVRARLWLVPVGLLFGLFALELGVRVWYGLNGSEEDRIRYIYDRTTIDGKTAQLIGVPYLNYSLNPAFDDINARGLRGPLVAIPKPDGVYRIVALGGSTTFGHALSVDESWPAQLERILRDDYGLMQVEVVNLGTPGYTSLDSLINLATRGLAHEPDLIIDYDGLNDAVLRMFQHPDCYSGDTPLLGDGMDRGIWQYAGDALPPSALYRLVGIRAGWLSDPAVFTDRLRHTGLCPAEPGSDPLELLAQNRPVYYERNLRSIAALAGAAGARVIFSTIAWDRASAEAALAADPSRTQARALLNAIDEQNAILRAVAAESGALLIDLAAEMGEGAYFQGDQVHQTAVGAARQAAIYAQRVNRLMLELRLAAEQPERP